VKPFDYREAFSRNVGLINVFEQGHLQKKIIAIAGCGGVGGVHLITLVRMGFTKFKIADFDEFEIGNFNRQYGAKMDSIGLSKVNWMKQEALAINPKVVIFPYPKIDASNVSEFLWSADIFIDGLDVFEIAVRRQLYAKARENGIWSVCAGPIGFGTSYLNFDPDGMSFDDYFGLNDQQTLKEQFASFILGLSPDRLSLKYLDRSSVRFKDRKVPSSMVGCQLASGVMGAEVLKILLNRGEVRAAPEYQQFDAYLYKMKRGMILFGGRYNPWFWLKRWFVVKYLLGDK